MTRFNVLQPLHLLPKEGGKEAQRRMLSERKMEDILYNNVEGSINESSSSSRMCFSWDYSNKVLRKELKTVAQRRLGGKKKLSFWERKFVFPDVFLSLFRCYLILPTQMMILNASFLAILYEYLITETLNWVHPKKRRRFFKDFSQIQFNGDGKRFSRKLFCYFLFSSFLFEDDFWPTSLMSNVRLKDCRL